MGKVKFVPISYWDKKTMKLTDNPTPEQWKQLEDICNELNVKYSGSSGCAIHPERDQKILTGYFNGHIDFQISKTNECHCEQIINDLIAIRNYEMIMSNR
ncbi:MAG: hypothetical protein QM764_13855 [Chitinophagaceae bacterium]